jgi:hypothetical protein
MLHDCLVGIIPRAEVPSLAKQMMHGSWKLPTTNSRSENLSLLSLVLYSSFLIGPSAILPGGLFVNRKTQNRQSKNTSHLEKGLSPKIRPSFLLDFKKKNKSGSLLEKKLVANTLSRVNFFSWSGGGGGVWRDICSRCGPRFFSNGLFLGAVLT